MSEIDKVGQQDQWRCWLCDQPVDPDASVNADLGPSVDSFLVVKAKKGEKARERLAHRACNTMKGKIAPVVPWSSDLVLGNPSPIFETVERLQRKGGKEIVATFVDNADAKAASAWLLDRLLRLAPGVDFTTQITGGGGHFMLALKLN